MMMTAEDRCDRCGSQAYVRTEHAAGDLLWCAHHAQQYELLIVAAIADDERHKLSV